MTERRPQSPTSLEPSVARTEASHAYNYVWTMLEKPERTEREDDLMAHAAHASRFHWEAVGEPRNHAIGEWQVSRVYAVLGRAEPALHHARRSLQICERHGIGDFVLAYAYEALARAHAVAGDAEAAEHQAGLAEKAAAAITDDGDREHLLADLTTLPRPSSR